ncbi:hypothetical protein ACFLS1_11975 [Verrucomicrobiota bacterium]
MMSPLPIVLIIVALGGFAQGTITAIRRNRFTSPPSGRQALLIGFSQCTGSLALLCLALWQLVPTLLFLVLTLILRIALARQKKTLDEPTKREELEPQNALYQSGRAHSEK